MWIVWLIGGGIAFGLSYVSPHAVRIVQQHRLRTRCVREHVLVLTYDDGPGRLATPKLLDLLMAEEAKATFFLLGRNVQSDPEALGRMRDEGHELGSHSQSHLNAWKVAPWRGLQDVNRGFAMLEVHGIDAMIFRPPYGKLNLLTWFSVIRRRIRFGWWTVVSGDTFSTLPHPESVVRAVERDGGGVVLMHDCDRTEDRLAYVLELTKQLLETARIRGWKVCTLGELLRTES